MAMELFCNGRILQNATWADIEAVLPELKDNADFGLCRMPWPETGPIRLDIESEDGNYLPNMLLADQRGGRGFVNPEGRGKADVIIGGYDYNAMAVTRDFDLVVRMIREFYETGDVAEELLK